MKRRSRWVLVATTVALGAGGLGLASALYASGNSTDAAPAVQAGPALANDQAAPFRAAIDATKPKNVILMLGDGMGESEMTSARYFQYGATGRLFMDALPFVGDYTTWSVKPAAAPPYLPDYDPDSASAGTAWATGSKTLDNRISQRPSAAITTPGGNDLKTVLELAQQNGKATGNVSTAEITDATPAVLGAHISQRKCQGPADTRATTGCPSEAKTATPPGLGSIAEQFVDHKIDVILGGGRARFEQTLTADTASPTVIASAQTPTGGNYRYVTDATGLNGVTTVQDKPLIGLFNPTNMTTEWATPAGGTSVRGDGNATPSGCTKDNRATTAPGEPGLPDMTTKAISLLEQKGGANGFFLQVEGASIDKQDHAADPCKQIGELIAFDNSVKVAMDYQKQHPDTLVVVTADHSHSSQIVAEDENFTNTPANPPNGPTGYSSNLTTADGSVMRMTWGTAGGPTAAAGDPKPTGYSAQHTGAEVRIAAVGPQAYNVSGLLDQTDLFSILNGFPSQPNPPSTVTTTTPGPATTVNQTATTTTPGPSTTVPGPPGPPTFTEVKVPPRFDVGLAGPKLLAFPGFRAAGLQASAYLSRAGKVTFVLKSGSKTLVTLVKRASRGAAVDVNLAPTKKALGSRARALTLTLTATASNADGDKAKAIRTIKVSRG